MCLKGKSLNESDRRKSFHYTNVCVRKVIFKDTTTRRNFVAYRCSVYESAYTGRWIRHHCRCNMDGRSSSIFTTALMIMMTRTMTTVTASSTSSPPSSTTIPLIVTTTPDPARCNGKPPPPGSGSRLALLAPEMLVYTCNPGMVETGSGSAVIRCDVNATSWSPGKGLVCELPEETPVGEFRDRVCLCFVYCIAFRRRFWLRI